MEKSKYMNPLWRAVDNVKELIRKKQDEQGNYDPLTLCDVEYEVLDRVATAVGEADKHFSQIKASYLLGLAVGFKYAELPREKLDQLISDCNPPD